MTKHKNKVLTIIGEFFKWERNNSKELYDRLHQERENIRMNPQSKTRQSDLSRLDKKISKTRNPRREYCKTLSDDELDRYIQSAYSIWEYAQKAFEEKTKGLSYEQYYNDLEQLELNKLYDSFYQATLERDHRHAMANPDKYPVHREHGYYLPNDDN